MNMSLRDVITGITHINVERFGEEDEFSDEDVLLRLLTLDGGGYFIETRRNKIVGFLVYQLHKDHMSCERRAVTRFFDGKGIGSKLTRKAIRMAKEYDLDYTTYCATYNLGSINSNIKCGCRITSIDEQWVHLIRKVKKR